MPLRRLLFIGILITAAPLSQAAEKAGYREVVDAAFPKPEGFRQGRWFVLQLRYLPRNASQFQILISCGRDSTGKAIVRTMNESLLALLTAQPGGVSPEEQARILSKVTVKTVPVTPRMSTEIYSQFWAAAGRSMAESAQWNPLVRMDAPVGILLDSSLFEIDYDDGLRSLHLVFSEMDPAHPYYALVTWMRELESRLAAR